MNTDKIVLYTKATLFIGIILFLVGYFAYTELQKNNYNQQILGYKQGQIDVSTGIIETVATCKPIPAITKDNINITIIAYECIKKA